MSAPAVTTVNFVTRSSCSNCGLHHPTKSYPMYKVNAVHREEAFATVVIHHDEPKVKGLLRIKIDTG